MVESRSPASASLDTNAEAPAARDLFRDGRIGHRREHDDSDLRVRLRNLTARVQSVEVREVHVEHDHVGLEPLRCLEQEPAVGDGSHDLGVQCEQPADGCHDCRVVVRNEHAGSTGQTQTSIAGLANPHLSIYRNVRAVSRTARHVSDANSGLELPLSGSSDLRARRWWSSARCRRPASGKSWRSRSAPRAHGCPLRGSR